MASPLIDFTWTPTSGPVGFTIAPDTFPPGPETRFAASLTPIDTIITFTAVTSALAHQQFISFEWDFGEGGRGYGRSVKHSFPVKTTEGQVSLTVRDSRHRTYHRSKMINLKSHDPLFLVLHDPLIPE